METIVVSAVIGLLVARLSDRTALAVGACVIGALLMALLGH